MRHKLGVYYAPAHDRNGDWDYIRRLQPPVVRVLMPGDAPTNLISRVHQAAPSARIALRWWDVDDGGETNKSAKLGNPEASATNDARAFLTRIEDMEQDAQRNSLLFPSRDKLIVNTLNEPPTWEHDKRAAVVAYSIAMVKAMAPHGIPVATLCLAVGHPEEWPPKWDWARPLVDVLGANPLNMLELHSYWQLEGPNHVWRDEHGNERKDWGALAGRYIHCPYDVPILVGEAGADGRLFNRRPNHTGWRGNISAAEYAGQLRFYLERIHEDPRIVAALPFLTDYQDGPSWGSFDTGDAHDEILSMVQTLSPVTAEPFENFLPNIVSAPPVAPPQAASQATLPAAVGYVTAQAGANLRQTPDVRAGNIIIAVPYGETVTVAATQKAGNGTRWAQVTYQGASGWMAADLLGVTPPAPLPTQPVDNWQRSIEFVRRWEGGWADDPNDIGGATNKGITIGTYTRWREAHGQPAPTKDDLRNLTDAEANQIYFEWYWKASGSDNMAWPLCLAHFDTAVNAGTRRAQEMLSKSGGDFIAYMGHLITWYATIPNFEVFGRAWIRRRAEILLEAAK